MQDYCLVMTEGDIRSHFREIKDHAGVMENRGDDSWYTMESALRDNVRALEQCAAYGWRRILIDGDYEAEAVPGPQAG